ncbi:MAG: HD domain-containing protein [Bryobacteraceae bacterium]
MITTRFDIPPLPILAARLAAARASAWFRQAAVALGLRRQAEFRLADLTIPDSQIVRRATALTSEVSPPFLLNHCLRTYLFGAAIGMRDGLRFDRELLYLAAIFHDLGFTERFRGPDAFELEGARAARSFLLEHGFAPPHADLVHEAIALHTSIGVAAEREPEIALVQAGSGFDVVGLRFEDISRASVHEIVTAHPRLHMKRELLAAAGPALRNRRGCPMSALMRLGFAGFVRRAPFAE